MKLTYPSLLFFLLFLASVSFSEASAQLKDITISYKDSLESEEDLKLISNNIFFSSTSSSVAELLITISDTTGWKLIGGEGRRARKGR